MNHKTIGFTPKEQGGKLSRVRRLASADSSYPLTLHSFATRLAAWDTRPRALCPKTPATPSRPYPCAVTGPHPRAVFGPLGWLCPGHRSGRRACARGLARAAGTLAPFASKGSKGSKGSKVSKRSQGYAGGYTALPSLTSLTGLAGAAFADSSSRLCPSLPEGLYVGLDSGLGWGSKLKTDEQVFASGVVTPPAVFPGDTALQLKRKTSYKMGLKLGYTLPSEYTGQLPGSLSLELQGNYASSEFKTGAIDLGKDAGGVAYFLQTNKASQSFTSVFGNVRWSHHLWSNWDVSLGAGLGYVRTLTNVGMQAGAINVGVFAPGIVAETTLNDFSNNLGWQAMLDLAYKFSPNAKFRLGYNLFGLATKPKHSFSAVNLNAGAQARGTLKLKSPMVHYAMAALEFSL